MNEHYHDSRGAAPSARRRRGARAALVAVVAVGALAIAACAPGGTDDTARDRIVIATPAYASHFVTDMGTWSYPATEISLAINSRLVANTYSPSTDDPEVLMQNPYDYGGELAESYDVSDDGLVYTFHLREGVLSQAGNPFTADDVIWSFEAKWALPTGAFKYQSPGIIDSLDQIQKVDDYTVTFTIPNPGYGLTLLGLLGNPSAQILDSTLLQEHATADDPYAGVAWAAENPEEGIGYGPYQVASMSEGTETVLEANPDYWGDAPAIETVVYRVVPDAATRAQAVRTGDVDVAESLNIQEINDLRADPAAKVFDIETNSFISVALVTNKAPFDDTAVRQAFAYAIPYDQIIDNVYFGEATRFAGLLDPSAPGYVGDGLPEYEYDPERARSILEEAGYPDGVEMTLTVTPDIPDTVAAGVQIQAEAAAGGFIVNLEQVPSAAYGEGTTAGTYESYLWRDFAIVLTPMYELNLFTAPGAAVNRAKWEDPVFYDLLATANAMEDPLSLEAGQAYFEAERYMLEQAPMVFIARLTPNYAIDSALTGWAWRSDNWLDIAQLSFE